jgi:hypothetical protein
LCALSGAGAGPEEAKPEAFLGELGIAKPELRYHLGTLVRYRYAVQRERQSTIGNCASSVHYEAFYVLAVARRLACKLGIHRNAQGRAAKLCKMNFEDGGSA